MTDFSAQTGRWIRAYRRDQGLTLQALADQVGCAPSHLSLIENGRREPRLSLLAAVAEALGVTLADLTKPEAPSGRDRLELALDRAQSTAAYRATGLPVLRPSKTVSTQVLEILVGLHEELARKDTVAAATPEEARRANAALRAEMRACDNYFANIEEIAGELLTAVSHQGGPVGERRIAQIADHVGFTLHQAPDLPHSARSVTDLLHRRIYVPTQGSGGTDPRTITLQAIGHQVLGHADPRDYADFLRQRVEVNYFAAAILIGQAQAQEMLKRAKAGRYLAVEDLRDAFGVSYEMAAHRFTNLITRHCGIRIHFLKVFEDGTIYKAYENNGLTLPTDPLGAIEGQVTCRKWASRQALDHGEVGATHFQYTDTPQGTFWSFAQTEQTSSGAFAVSLGVRFDDAQWFRGRESPVRLVSTCPDPACCRRTSADLETKWAGRAWPSAKAHAHLLSTLPPGTFPGVDEIEVIAFLERHAADA